MQMTSNDTQDYPVSDDSISALPANFTVANEMGMGLRGRGTEPQWAGSLPSGIPRVSPAENVPPRVSPSRYHHQSS